MWACRSCNSAKAAHDVLEWLAQKGRFPPLLLLRRYLKRAIEIGLESGQMDTPLNHDPQLPFTLAAIPKAFPKSGALCLRITALD